MRLELTVGGFEDRCLVQFGHVSQTGTKGVEPSLFALEVRSTIPLCYVPKAVVPGVEPESSA